MSVALAIDGALETGAQPRATRALLDQLITQVQTHTESLLPWAALATLGFAGNAKDYTAPHNSSLSWVIANRCGIPITLAVVLMAVARAEGMRAQGLNHPGHFLVQVDEHYVDPFQMAALPDDPKLLAQVKQAALATPRDIALRMLNNLKHIAVTQQQFSRALDLLDTQLSVYPTAWELWFEKARFWQQLGSRSSAQAILAALLEQPLPQPLREAVATLLAQLKALPPEIVH